MKFKDNISFITYLTSSEMYGKLAVSMSTESGCPPSFDFYFKDNIKDIPRVVKDTLHNILYDHFFYADNYSHISEYSFELVNNNGILEMVNSVYSSNHSFEEDAIKSSIRYYLEDELFERYTLSLHFSGAYGKNGKEEVINVESFYLARFDENDKEIECLDEIYKSELLSKIINWAEGESEDSSRGEYEFDTFDLDLHISYSEQYETNCDFIEESKSELIDLSSLEVDPEDAVEFEVEFK
jgi:hypothetical protein